MSEYKRLTGKDSLKLKIYKKIKKLTGKSLKWTLVYSGIFLMLVSGVFVFYKFVDNNYKNKEEFEIEGTNLKSKIDAEGTSDLDELSKNEFERESKKIEKLEENLNEEDMIEEDADSFKKSYDFSEWNSSCDFEIMVINKDNPISESLKIQTKNCKGKEVATKCCDDLEKMINDAKKEGINLWISSGYRDIVLQKKLFNRQVERQKNKEVISQEEAEKRAATVVARPYTSEHNTGLAVDFNGVEDNFYKTKEYKWLINNAHKYGFIERYQKKWESVTGVIYEPWHFRYVGSKYASLIKDSGLCLEKYVAEKLMK